MDLMKELLTTSTEKVEEATHQYSSAGYSRFKKIFDIVDRELDHLHGLTKAGSQFRKLVEELGGDPAIVEVARRALMSLSDAMADLEMSVGMAQDPHQDDMGNL